MRGRGGGGGGGEHVFISCQTSNREHEGMADRQGSPDPAFLPRLSVDRRCDDEFMMRAFRTTSLKLRRLPRHPTFQFVLLKTAWRRRERSVRDRQLPSLSLSIFLSFCLPFEITLRCHDIRQVPRSPPLPPPPPPSFLPTKSSSVSFVSIFTEFREDAHISRREARAEGWRAEGEEGGGGGSLEEKGKRDGICISFSPLLSISAAAKRTVDIR